MVFRRSHNNLKSVFRSNLLGAWSAQDPMFSYVASQGIRSMGAPYYDEGAAVKSTNVKRIQTDIGGRSRHVWDFPLTDNTADYIAVTDDNDIFEKTTFGSTGGLHTFAVRCMVRNVSTRGGVMAKGDGFSTAGWWLYKEGTGGTWRFATGSWSAGAEITSGPGLNEWVTMVGWRDDAGNNTFLRVNNFTDGPNSGADTFPSTASALVLAASSNTGTSGTKRIADSQIAWAAAWSKILTYGEIDALVRDVDGPFEWRKPLPIWIPVAAGAGWTGKIVGVTNPSKINGIAVAGISKINGVA